MPGHLAELDLGGATETVLIRDVGGTTWARRSSISDSPRRVSAEVRRDRGDDRGAGPCPRAAAAGGVLEQVVHSLTIKCPAGAIPDSIKVDVSDLQVDQGIHVSELKLPPERHRGRPIPTCSLSTSSPGPRRPEPYRGERPSP